MPATREVHLKALDEARQCLEQHLEQRQRDADIDRGRSEDDQRQPRGEHGLPIGGRYQREFGMPEAKTVHLHFTSAICEFGASDRRFVAACTTSGTVVPTIASLTTTGAFP
jgi:hypothetical protein